jgi:Domain of unknown function (DUF5615)
MNILVDENIARQVVELLRQDGHNVNYTIQGQSISDDIVLGVAHLILNESSTCNVALPSIAGYSNSARPNTQSVK